MSWALVAKATPVGVSSGNATTTGIDTTGANLLVVYVATATVSASASTISDSKGNTWTLAGLNSKTTDNNRQGAFFYAKNPTVGAGHTFTGNSGSFITIFPLAYSGANVTAPFDQHNENEITAAVTTIQPGSVTPGTAGSLVITGVSTFTGSGGATFSIDSGFTVENSLGSASFEGGAVADLFPDSLSVNPTWTIPAGEVAANIVTFVPAGSGSTGLVATLYFVRQAINRASTY